MSKSKSKNSKQQRQQQKGSNGHSTTAVKQQQQQQHGSTTTAAAAVNVVVGAHLGLGLMEPEDDELDVTCDTLEWFVAHGPGAIRGSSGTGSGSGTGTSAGTGAPASRLKRLKRAGWAFGRVLHEAAAGGAGQPQQGVSGVGGSGAGGAGGAASSSSIHARISHLLSLSLYPEALCALFEMHTLRIAPKLGALQRWVRECDATAKPGYEMAQEEKEEREMVLRCLDMVLRVCGGQPRPSRARLAAVMDEGEEGDDDHDDDDGEVIQRVQPWRVRETEDGKRALPRKDSSDPLWSLIQQGVDAAALTLDSPPSPPPAGFRVVQRTPGAERRPPNVFPCTVWASDATVSPVPFAHLPASHFSPVTPLAHPLIPTCRMLLNVLPTSTCRAIITAANALGWEPDQAAGGSAVEKTSVLAHNVVWLADEAFVAALFERIKPHVEERVNGGRVRGINRRFRVYRYGPRQVYRPHIDGAWPAAGLGENDQYLHDSSPPDDPLWSRYTLLIYLNDDINVTPSAPQVPGATTFFLPHPSSQGTMLACPIAPVQGAVLVFPHGDARGSLLHEGSPVGDGGWKCVIRTDLLYEAQGFGEFAPSKIIKSKQQQGQAGAARGVKRQREVVDAGEDDEGAAAVRKVAKVVDERTGAKREVVVPKAVGEQNLGDGEEGAGG